jgi:phosphotransferase system enzyme I (PtsI)
MVNDIGEFEEAAGMLEEAREQLRQRDVPFGESLPVGCMVETPAAAMSIDLLAEHCQFISLGRNDLLQYLLAVDRGNSHVEHLYMPGQPAVLRFLRQTFKAARDANLPFSICGEMASDPIYAPLLIGLGVADLSIAPLFLPEIKYLVQQMSAAAAEDLAREVLAMRRCEDILVRLRAFTGQYISSDLGREE